MEPQETAFNVPQNTMNLIQQCNEYEKFQDKFKDARELWLYLKELEGKLDKRIENSKSLTSLSGHLELLHEYNNMKDTAQVLLGTLANLLGISVTEAHEKFNLQNAE